MASGRRWRATRRRPTLAPPSRRRPWPRSLRWRLTLAVAAVLVLAFLATLVVVYRETSSRLRAQIDNDLHAELAAFSSRLAAVGPSPTPARIAVRAEDYFRTQPFSTSSLLLYAVIGGRVHTNEPEALGLGSPDADDDQASAAGELTLARTLTTLGPGLSTQHAADVGALRLLVGSVAPPGGPRVRVAAGEPLAPVESALDGILRGFALGGSLTLAGALLVGVLLSAGFTRPLRRMALIAARVDAGDLSPRIDAHGPPDETRILAEAFDHMLDRLEEAFARQQAFVSDASHELRTPLTAIRGQLEVLARNEHPDAADVRRVQQLVAAEVDRMTRLTEDLLLLAHTDESRPVPREPIGLDLLLAEVLDSAEPTTDRRLRLRADAPGVLHADRDRVTQALRNLLRNAIEHTQPGGAIELGAREAAGERVQIWVDDDGPGIPVEERERVFNRFHRTDAARARHAGGTGLGLAIVHAIASAHGGRVWVEQAPLGGARVVIELPGYRRRPY